MVRKGEIRWNYKTGLAVEQILFIVLYIIAFQESAVFILKRDFLVMLFLIQDVIDHFAEL